MLLAFGGICVALSVIALYFSSIISINTIALLTVSSFFVGVMFIEGGLKYALITYFSVSFLAFLMPVERGNVIFYIGIFGWYPILKSYIEKIRRLPVEIIVKIIFYFVVSFITVIVTAYLTGGVEKGMFILKGALTLAGVIILCIYDFALSILFNFYIRRIRSKIRR